MPKLTKQGLESSLLAMLEFGYKARERGDNLQKAIEEASPAIRNLVSGSDNCRDEILKITQPKPKRRQYA